MHEGEKSGSRFVAGESGHAPALRPDGRTRPAGGQGRPPAFFRHPYKRRSAPGRRCRAPGGLESRSPGVERGLVLPARLQIILLLAGLAGTSLRATTNYVQEPQAEACRQWEEWEQKVWDGKADRKEAQ